MNTKTKSLTKEKQSLPLKVKLIILVIVWAVCIWTVFSAIASITMQIFVFLLALSCTVVMAIVQTMPDTKPPSERALGFFQQLSYGALSGFIGGLVWGVAGRTIMRFVANVAEKAPQFNLRLTLMMIVATAVMGLLVGIIYLIIRKWIPANVWVKGSLFGLLIAFTLGYILYISPVMQADIARVGLEWRPLIVSLFIPNFIAYGLVTALSFKQFTSLD